jgi:hypothetical protein
MGKIMSGILRAAVYKGKAAHEKPGSTSTFQDLEITTQQ